MLTQILIAIQNTDFFTDLRGSGYEYPIILSLHLCAMAVFGGALVATDLRLLGWALKGVTISEVVNRLRWPKRIGFLAAVTCGLLLFGSKAEAYALNPFFRVKVTLFLFVLVHAIVFRPRVYNKPELLDMAPQPPMRAKLAGGISLVLWLSIMIAGRGIGYINAPSGLHFAELLRKVAGAV